MDSNLSLLYPIHSIDLTTSEIILLLLLDEVTLKYRKRSRSSILYLKKAVFFRRIKIRIVLLWINIVYIFFHGVVFLFFLCLSRYCFIKCGLGL